MLNNRIMKNIAMFLIIVLALTFALPSQEVLAIEMVLDSQTLTDLIYKKNFENDDNAISQSEASTEAGSLAVKLNSCYDILKQAYKDNDITQFRKSVNDTIKLLNDYNRSIIEELDKNEKILEELGNKEVLKRNSEFRAQILSKLLELKTIFEELEYISKNVNSLDESDAVHIEEKLAKVDKLFMPEQPENPLGSNLPHRNLSEQPKVASTGAEAATLYMNGVKENNLKELPKEPQPEDLAETQETRLNDQIKELADSLGTAVNMYEYVRNNIDFEPYYGSRKGAAGTLAHKSGNDYDQASLLIAMLRYKNIPARYVRGLAEIDIDKAMEWTQADTPEAAAKILAAAGIPVTTLVSGGKIAAVCVEHVWVEAYVPYGIYRGLKNEGQSIWVPLDPSFKKYQRVEGLTSLQEVIGVDLNTFNQRIMTIDKETGKATGVDTDAYDELITEAVQRLENYITYNNLGNKTYSEVFGENRILEQKLGMLPLSLPYKTRGTVAKFNKVSEQYSDVVSFAIYGQDPFGLNFTGSRDFNLEYKSVDLFNKKVTLSYEPATKEDAAIIEKYGDIFSVPAYLVKMVPVLKIDGETVARGKEVGLGYRQQFEIGIKSAGQSKEIINNDVVVGSYYNIGFNYQKISEFEIDNISNKLKDLKYTEKDIYSDEQLGEILNFAAKSYFAELDFMDEVIAEQMNVSVVRQLNECITGFRVNAKYLFMTPVELTGGGLYIDVDRNVYSVVSKDGDKDTSSNYMIASGMMGSALEHSIWEQVTGVEAISTIKVLEIAQEEDIPIYTLSKIDFEEKKDKLNLSNSVIEEISNAVNSGKIVIVAAEEVQVGDWSGAGYIVMDDSGAAGYMISGGIAGGSSSIKADLAFLANLGFGIADVVESVKLISLGIKALAISRILGVITIIVGLVFLGLALYSLWNTISLYKDYKNGDYEAGQELIEDLLWNIGLTLATFGLSSLLKYFAKRLALKKLTEIFGESVAKNITKNAEAYDVYRTIKKIRKLGVSDDVIKEFAERMGKDSLDWLENVKKIFNFTDDELRKLVKLGDDLYNYSDEFLEAFKNSNYQDEIIEAVSKYKDDAVDAITNYGDDAAKAISKNIDPDLIKRLDDLGIDPSDYDKFRIVGRESAEAAVEAIETLRPLGLDTEQNIVRFTKLSRAGVPKENIINVIQNNIRSSSYIQKKIIDTFEEFSHFDDAAKWKLKNAVDEGLIDVSTWVGKLNGDILTEKFTPEEAFAMERYLRNGFDVFRISPMQTSGTADFIIDGLEIEFKGLNAKTYDNIFAKAIAYADESFTSKPDGKGADKLILDCSYNNLDLTLEEAKIIIEKIKSKYADKLVEIWTKFGDIGDVFW